MQRLTPLIFTALFILLINSNGAQAKAKYLFKIGSLAPSGSVWAIQFDKFAAEVKEKTNGEVAFRSYAGGVMGDDQAMYRKMRVGQLHGGGFTMTGIGKIVPDFRVIGVPFLFNSYAEIDYVVQGLLPTFINRFREKKLELISMTEVGFIYAMSTKPVATIDALKDSTNWIPSGDPVSGALLTTLGISPVQLSIPDVLSSLQSGLVDTVYNSFYGSIILQWFTKAKYITDMPYGYAYGVFLLDGKKFGQLPDKYKKLIHATAAKHFPVLLEKTRTSNHDSRQVLMDRGVEFIKADDDTVRQLQESRDLSIKDLVKSAFSPEIYQKTIQLLEEFRNNQPERKGKDS
ncbi:MAG: TRAP transporter substrate-binding protein DctP [Deltaproteobacteria bacterium]|nr:TRAP transporter substrate-binding protein DctP [Deltaproteobacteria bacterium]